MKNNTSRTKGSNDAATNAGIVHVVLEVDVDMLKQYMINGLS